MNQPETASVISSSAEVSSAEYFAQRQLKQGTVGWLLLIGLGVAYVISGDFAAGTLVLLKVVGVVCLLPLLLLRLCTYVYVFLCQKCPP